MNPVFPRVNQAISFTLDYYEIGRISDYMKYLAGEPNLERFMLSFNKSAYIFHEHMEDEINQVIYTSNHNAQSALFDLLKEWLSDVRIFELNEGWIVSKIENYNEKVYEKFLSDVKEQERKFQEKPEYQLEHGQQYEVKHSGRIPFASHSIPYITTETNNKFFCLNGNGGALDMKHLPVYFDVVGKIVANFRNILSKYVSKYDRGEIKAADVSFEKAQITRPNPPLLEQPGKESIVKLKTNLTSGQILYLFKTLKTLNVFGKVSNIDLCRFIANSIGTRGKEDLSADNLAKVWSAIDINDIAYWYNQFPEMSKQVIKDNPNKIEYKDFGNK